MPAVASLRPRRGVAGGSRGRQHRCVAPRPAAAHVGARANRDGTAGAAERVLRDYVGTKPELAALAAPSRLLIDSDPVAISFYDAVIQARVVLVDLDPRGRCGRTAGGQRRHRAIQPRASGPPPRWLSSTATTWRPSPRAGRRAGP